MKYYVNPPSMAGAFSVPGIVADNYLRIAGAVQLKVLLWAIRHMTADGIDAESVAAALNIQRADADDALTFWADASVLIAPGKTAEPEKSVAPAAAKPAIKPKTVKPTRKEVAQRGAECAELAFLLREAQAVFGRALKTSEASTLVWLYDDEGMSAALILTLLEFAASQQRCNIGFIERTAIDWINNQIVTVADADRYLNELARKRSAWHVVEASFGIDRRMPSTKELELSDKWVNEFKFSREILRQAYNCCVDSTGKLSMPYIKKILEQWHKAGVKTPDDIKALDTKKSKTKPKRSFSTYDMADLDKLINSED